MLLLAGKQENTAGVIGVYIMSSPSSCFWNSRGNLHDLHVLKRLHWQLTMLISVLTCKISLAFNSNFASVFWFCIGFPLGVTLLQIPFSALTL